MANIKRFHPGVYLKEYLDAMDMKAKEFSLRTGISERMVSALINGKVNITFDLAYKISVFLGTSVNVWTNLQNSYDLYLKEEEEKEILKDEIKLAKKVKKYLIELGVIKSEDSDIELLNVAKRITKVNYLALLNIQDSFVCFKQQNLEEEPDYYYQNFWISMALNEARAKISKPYNRNLLMSYLPNIRELTTFEPEVFFPKLYEIFDECGVSFVFLPYLSKSEIYGATKWFSNDNVMLAVSNRGKRADLFWFTLFHEIAHVLMEHRRVTLINFSNVEDEEADTLAADLLIDKKEWDRFISKEKFDEYSLLTFSKKIGVLPSLTLGRLHKEINLDYGYLDKKLMKYYDLSDFKY